MSEVNGLIKKYSSLIDKEMKRFLPEDNSKLSRAMRYSIFAGGKRFRPLLMVEAALACGGKIKDIIPAACAIEMIHTFTLIHDDLPAMDDSDLRRGKPANHKVFGEDIAILAGDALNTLAFEVIAKNVKQGKAPQAAAELAEALIRVVRGQVMDLEAEGKRITYDQLKRIHLFKTSALVEASCKIGAIIAGASNKKVNMMADYGRHLGLAFQIADDLLDYESTSEIIGKPAGADQKLKKATYPAMMGIEKAKNQAKKHIAIAIKSLSVFKNKAQTLKEIAQYALLRKT